MDRLIKSWIESSMIVNVGIRIKILTAHFIMLQIMTMLFQSEGANDLCRTAIASLRCH